MSKVKTIRIHNMKSIGDFEANFNGCTAIVTAGNNMGKSTLLKSIPDRIRGEKPGIIVKQGETNGKGVMELTTGERFEWEVTAEGKEKLAFYTKEGFKAAVTKEIAGRFFPPVFDIDKFLQSSPKQQSLQLQKAVGIDFTDIDSRYQIAYNDRTLANSNRDSEIARLSAMGTPAKVEPITLESLTARKESVRAALNLQYTANVEANKQLENAWKAKCAQIQLDKSNYEAKVSDIAKHREEIHGAIAVLLSCGYENTPNLYTWRDEAYILPPVKAFTLPAEPTYVNPMPDRSELDAIDNEILAATDTNMKAQVYANYVAQLATVEAAKVKATESDAIVKQIEKERKELIASAKLPVGVEITPDGITVNGLPLDRSQISSSRIHITALQFALLNCGEVRTLYFDASYLDRNSLNEVNDWAKDNDLQLLIERPDFDGGDMKYELLCDM